MNSWVHPSVVFVLGPFTDDSHFANQVHTLLGQHRRMHVINDRLDVRRRGAAQVDDEVDVLDRYLRAADSESLQSAGLDEPCRMITGRIAKYGAGIGLAERLGGDAAGQEFLDLLPGCIAVTFRQAQPGGDKERMKDEG